MVLKREQKYGKNILMNY